MRAFIPETRWSRLTEAEIDALPEAEKKELIREELRALRASLDPSNVEAVIKELAKSQSEIYQRLLRP